MLAYFFIATSMILAFAVTYRTTSWAVRTMKSKGITAIDVHKPGKPAIASMGGIAVIVGYASGVMLTIIPFSQFLPELLSALVTVLLLGMMGMIDDILDLSRKTKTLMPLIASLPLIIVVSNDRTMLIPLVGVLGLGVLYPLVLVPIGLATASNLTNMLAGLNGLEAGMGSIAAASLLIATLTTGKQLGALIVAPIIGSLIAFLLYNRYPAKILPGNSTTYVIGGVIALSVILGDMEVIGVVCLVPYIFEFFVKGRTLFRGQCFGKLEPDGTLKPSSSIQSLTHIMMKIGNYNEKQVVVRLWLMEALFGVIAILVAYANLYYQLLK